MCFKKNPIILKVAAVKKQYKLYTLWKISLGWIKKNVFKLSTYVHLFRWIDNILAVNS